jgi:hypothetical protein
MASMLETDIRMSPCTSASNSLRLQVSSASTSVKTGKMHNGKLKINKFNLVFKAVIGIMA